MKKIMNGFVLVFPYLFALFAYLISYLDKAFLPFCLMAAIMIILFVVSIIMTVIDVISKWNSKTALLFNLLLKIIYVPVHIVLFLIMGGMGNPFLFLFMGIPLMISGMFMGITGTIAVVAIIKGYREEKYRLSKTIVYSILSYCYIADIVVAVMAYRDGLKCENEIVSIVE